MKRAITRIAGFRKRVRIYEDAEARACDEAQSRGWLFAGERADVAEALVDRLQCAVDEAYMAMVGSESRGGGSEREAWATALRALSGVATVREGRSIPSAAASREERP
jgi:hypothetical protein